MTWMLFVIECLGVVAFSLSSTIMAVEKRTDPVGALIFSLASVFGGGLLRDITLGSLPPQLFRNPSYWGYAAVAIPISLGCYLLAYMPKMADFLRMNKDRFWIHLLDTVGLSVFCIAGINVALENGAAENRFLAVFCGCLTGVGGGILRDLFACEIPLIFRKHVYLLPTVFGGILYTYLIPPLGQLPAMLVSIALIMVLRICAIVFHWNFPIPGAKPKEK